MSLPPLLVSYPWINAGLIHDSNRWINTGVKYFDSHQVTVASVSPLYPRSNFLLRNRQVYGSQQVYAHQITSNGNILNKVMKTKINIDNTVVLEISRKERPPLSLLYNKHPLFVWLSSLANIIQQIKQCKKFILASTCPLHRRNMTAIRLS